MTDWIDHLTKSEAQAIVALQDAPDNSTPRPTKARFMARDDRGERSMRYTRPTKGELDRIRAKA